ncbi:hypothetical protein LEM8419_03532 [Neolewinella maritima]|uniref:Uncharacterized protein n=1 Tax=Neolewinella maritima TaxID=1383882 RepID=A0ABM9B5I8_9BACT|nr:hypothetical protein [Neolewinella maritima]CAH1002660.1 hypothetical protein LEM8419_03532 [Neolewinella maritima]
MPFKSIIDGALNIFSNRGLAGLIALVLIILAYILAPEARTWIRESREQDAKDRIVRMDFAERQYEKLEAQVVRLETRADVQSLQIARLTVQLEEASAGDKSAPVAIWRLTKYFHIDEVNDVFVDLILRPYGITREDAIGKSWSEVFREHPQALRAAAEYEQTDVMVQRSGKPYVDDSLYTIAADGSKQYWRVTKWAVYVRGNFRGIKGVATPL